MEPGLFGEKLVVTGLIADALNAANIAKTKAYAFVGNDPATRARYLNENELRETVPAYTQQTDSHTLVARTIRTRG